MDGTYPFRITFPTPITPGLTLYKLPGWSEVTYTTVDAYTVEVNLTITDGELDPPFVLGADILPPTMETIVEAEGEYFNSAPAFSNFGFDDGLALNDGWYQIDSYSGVWTSLFTDVTGTSWDNDGWTLPGFDSLADGSHTIYFRASDDTGNEEGESGEWSWQFNKTTPTTIEPMIDFDPDTLNLTSNGKWVTVFIEMPEGYDVHDIDGSTVLLNDEVSAYLGKEGWAKADANDGNIMDHDGDGISERMVKFEMESVKQILAVGDEVEITISGLVDGIGFEGTISIRVIDKGGEGKVKGK